MFGRALRPLLGESVASGALKRLGTGTHQQRQQGGLKIALGSGLLGASGAFAVPPHTFFGGPTDEW